VSYVLTRGYKGIAKVRYFFLVRRNRAIWKAVPKPDSIRHIVFHEGNVSKIDQIVIRIFSKISIEFVSVEDDFKPEPQHLPITGTARDIGYRLMCRFQYLQVWGQLESFDVAIRVDEDCLLESIPPLDKLNSTMVVGALSPEPHSVTLETLVPYLEDLGLGEFFDHKFPYTNCFVTQLSFWRQPSVSELLTKIGAHPGALVNRWGDLPVLGVALKAIGAWDSQGAVDSNLQYRHLSHNSWVQNGQITERPPGWSIRLVRLLRQILHIVKSRISRLDGRT
jgi:hypothetical protein